MEKTRYRLIRMIKRFMIGAISLLLALYTSGLLCEGRVLLQQLQSLNRGTISLWDRFLEKNVIPIVQFCITTIYGMSIKLTITNMVVLSTKYLPVGLYLYTLVKTVYRASRERLKVKQMELEDIVLQIAIVETKQSIRDTECAERTAQLERESERLREVRAKVRDVIAGNECLRGVLERFERRSDMLGYRTDEDIMELLKNLALDKNAKTENFNKIKEYNSKGSESVSANSDYSSVSDGGGEHCGLKIIRVTKIYRMAFMKHHIKQKRLRRANKHGLLKKKLDSTRKMLESWQKSLGLVLCTLAERDETLEQAMAKGDCPKRQDSDTDSELRASNACDDYSTWDHPASYGDCFQISQDSETSGSLEDFEPQEYNDKYCRNYYKELETTKSYLDEPKFQEEQNSSALMPLPLLPEETSSQMLAIQETKDLDD